MPEYNLIQAPEKIQRLSKLFGIRQAHVTPTLNEGVQAVVLLDDVRDDKVNVPSRTFAGRLDPIAAGDGAGLVPYIYLENPLGSGVTVLLRRWWFQMVGGTINNQVAVRTAITGPASLATIIGEAKGFDRSGSVYSAPVRGTSKANVASAQYFNGVALTTEDYRTDIFLGATLTPAASDLAVHTQEWPRDLCPSVTAGKAFVAVFDDVNGAVQGGFLWTEEVESSA